MAPVYARNQLTRNASPRFREEVYLGVAKRITMSSTLSDASSLTARGPREPLAFRSEFLAEVTPFRRADWIARCRKNRTSQLVWIRKRRPASRAPRIRLRNFSDKRGDTMPRSSISPAMQTSCTPSLIRTNKNQYFVFCQFINRLCCGIRVWHMPVFVVHQLSLCGRPKRIRSLSRSASPQCLARPKESTRRRDHGL
ncbi:hypothetical protein SAMN05216304_101636 [Bosea sp. OK403]|nr:hypothetical protein SAMN05216304_101636 [Bosea sp. OK403]